MTFTAFLISHAWGIAACLIIACACALALRYHQSNGDHDQ